MLPSPSHLTVAGWYHLVFFGVLMPLAAIRTWRRLVRENQPLPQRLKYFRSTAGFLAATTLLSVIVARAQGIDVFTMPTLTWRTVGAGVAMYAITVLGVRPRWRRAVEQRKRIVYLFMPETSVERAWWIVVCVLAGLGEEITWRGVLAALLTTLTGSYLGAALLTAASFGVGHFLQGWKSALVIGILSLGFQVIVWLSGSLYIAMAVHVACDITAGLTYARLGRELRYRLEETAASAAV